MEVLERSKVLRCKRKEIVIHQGLCDVDDELNLKKESNDSFLTSKNIIEKQAAWNTTKKKMCGFIMWRLFGHVSKKSPVSTLNLQLCQKWTHHLEAAPSGRVWVQEQHHHTWQQETEACSGSDNSFKGLHLFE